MTREEGPNGSFVFTQQWRAPEGEMKIREGKKVTQSAHSCDATTVGTGLPLGSCDVMATSTGLPLGSCEVLSALTHQMLTSCGVHRCLLWRSRDVTAAVETRAALRKRLDRLGYEPLFFPKDFSRCIETERKDNRKRIKKATRLQVTNVK